MNNLSTLIYLAEILPNFGMLLGLLGFSLLGLWLIVVITTGFYNDMSDIYKRPKKDYPKIKGYLIPITLLFTVSILVPSKETIYLIAGSEAGEYVVSTPEAQEIITDIHAIIKKQLEGYASE